MKKYIAYDIEISRQIPDEETDWKIYRPLGISCAATLASDDIEPNLWYSKDEKGNPLLQMTVDDIQAMVDWLWASALDGYLILTHNGLGFDFDITAEESGHMAGKCKTLAVEYQVDILFNFFCYKGFPVGLDAVSKGMGLSGKTEGVDGSMAPQLWANGEYQTVLDYVGQDVKATLEVAQAIEAKGFVRWISRRGRPNYCPFPDGLLTVRECLELPEPDTSWMDSPLPRSRFTSWMEAAVNE